MCCTPQINDTPEGDLDFVQQCEAANKQVRTLIYMQCYLAPSRLCNAVCTSTLSAVWTVQVATCTTQITLPMVSGFVKVVSS